MWETLFTVSNTLVLPGWAILILVAFVGDRLPGWVIEIPRLVIPLILSAAYGVIVLVHFAGAEGGFGSLAEVRQLFQTDPTLLAGWQHYLAFDLFVGAWAVERMRRAGAPALLQIPILASVLMLGPLGFLLAVLTAALTEQLTKRSPA